MKFKYLCYVGIFFIFQWLNKFPLHILLISSIRRFINSLVTLTLTLRINTVKKYIVKIFDCFFLLRIPLLIPVWTVLILGWITGSNTAVPGGVLINEQITFSNERFLWISLISFSLIVAFIYVVNQIVDIESDRVNHKLFILPNGLLSLKTAWVSAFVCATLGILGGIIYLDMVMVFLFVSGLVLGIMYDLPPFNLKNHAWGGTIANFLGHGVVTFLVGWYAANFGRELTIPFIQTGLIVSLSAGFANAAVFLTTTIPDAQGDRLIGKKTFCVIYGEKKTAIAATIACAFSFAFAFTLEFNSWVMIIPAAASFIVFSVFVFSTNQDQVFKTFRWPVFILSTFVVLFVPMYGVIIIITLLVSRIYYKKRFNFEYPTLKNK